MVDQKIALVLPSGHFYNTPCVPNLAKFLAQHGCKVDVYLARNLASPSGTLEIDNIRLIWFPILQKHSKERVALLSFGFFGWIGWKLITKHYNYVIAIGIRGLFVVGLLSIFFGFKYIYNSLEIYSGDSFTSLSGRIFKLMESYFNQRASYSIIQDHKRADILRIVNALQDHETLLFPNAPFSPTNVFLQRKNINKVRHHIRDRFGIPEGKYLVVYSGSLEAKWSGFQSITEIVPELPENFLLFMQNRMNPLAEKFDDINVLIEPGRLIVSTTPLSVEDYNDLVSVADIGLAWYESKEDNIRYVGLSSGKIASFLSQGKPVVVNTLPMYKEIFQKYQCGKLVNYTTEIPAALITIVENYEKYSDGARRAYKEFYDMNKYSREILDALTSGVSYHRKKND